MTKLGNCSKSIFMKGGCDIEAISFYLCHKNITKEAAVWSEQNGLVYYTGHTIYLNNIVNKTYSINKFIDPVCYQTLFYEFKYKIYVFSLIIEKFVGVYKNNLTGELIPYGEALYDARSCTNEYINGKHFLFSKKLVEKDYEDLTKFEFLGTNPIENTLENVQNVVDSLDGNSKIIFVLGPTIHDELYENNPNYLDACEYFSILNTKLVGMFNDRKNVFFLNPNKYLERHFKGKYFYKNTQSVTHYKRIVYKKLAKDLCEIDNSFKFTYSHVIKRRLRKILVKFKILKK